MKFEIAAAAIALWGIPVVAAAQSITVLPSDAAVKIGSIEAVCTGAGLDARQNPKWSEFPLKVEVAGRGGQYLGDIRLTLRQNGQILAVMACDEPWILIRSVPGRYQVEAETEGKTAASTAFVPQTGQGRIILRFPDLGNQSEPSPGGVNAPTEQEPPKTDR